MKPDFVHTCLLRLLHLYPRAWRERYAEEAAAVIEQRPASFVAIFDMLLSILDAYMHRDLFTERKLVLVQRVCSSYVMIYCAAFIFSIIIYLYTVAGPFFWYPGLIGERVYTLTDTFIDYSLLFLALITVTGSLVFLIVLCKQVLADEHRGGFYAWGLLIASAIVALPFILSQIVVPANSSYALAHLIMAIPYVSDLLTIPGSEICVALVFVGLQQVLDRTKAGQFTSAIVWLSGIAAPIVLLIIRFHYAPSYLDVGTLDIQIGNILLSLIVFGSLFLLAQRKRRGVASMWAGYVHLMFPALMTLFMTTILLALLANYVDMRSLRYSVMSLVLLFLALLTVLSYISLWRGFKAQRALA